MKELRLDVDNLGRVSPSNYSGFIVGEHNSGRIAVCFSESEMPQCDYFRMYFETSAGQKVFSKQLHLEENYIYYNLPFDVTSLGHTLYWQLCGYKMEGEECSLIYKTEVVPIALGGSLSGDGNVAEENYIPEFQEILNNVEEFNEKFSLRIGEVSSVASTEPPSVTIREEGDYVYYLDFSIPTAPSTPTISKANYSISATSWGLDLTTSELYNANVTRTSVIILVPQPSCVEEFNDCNVAVYSQRKGYLSFCCTKVPQNEITFSALVVEV